MNKLGTVGIIVGFVIVAYLLLLVFMTVIVDSASSANATMAATSNMSNYPGTAEGIIAAPWILWFVPGVVGMIAIIVVLKKS
jgi:hypothetical protein